ncbi:hypothetical protein K469DRAFT_577576, partial [Zopfia rhizophila CBS 207.26]
VIKAILPYVYYFKLLNKFCYYNIFYISLLYFIVTNLLFYQQILPPPLIEINSK